MNFIRKTGHLSQATVKSQLNQFLVGMRLVLFVDHNSGVLPDRFTRHIRMAIIGNAARHNT